MKLRSFEEEQIKAKERKLFLGNKLREGIGGEVEVNLELGCGNGHFLVDYAKNHYGEICVGVDRQNMRIERAERKRNREGLGNLFFIKGDVFELLEVVPEEVRWRNIFILFSDPWPKRRHHERRLIQVNLLDSLGRKSDKDTRLFFRTDFYEYYEWAKGVIGGHISWRILEGEEWGYEYYSCFQERAKEVFSIVAAIK